MINQFQESTNTTSVRTQLQMLLLLAKSTQSTLNDIKGIFKCYNLTNFFRGVDTEQEIIDFAIEREESGSFLSSKY